MLLKNGTAFALRYLELYKCTSIRIEFYTFASLKFIENCY